MSAKMDMGPDGTPEMAHTTVETFDVIGFKNDTWVLFTKNVDRERALNDMAMFRFGSPSVTWRVRKRIVTTTEEWADEEFTHAVIGDDGSIPKS